MALSTILLALSLVISSFAAPITDLEARSPNNSKSMTSKHLAPAIKTHTYLLEAIASLFGWNWDSVAQECAFLASAGYGYVQG